MIFLSTKYYLPLTEFMIFIRDKISFILSVLFLSFFNFVLCAQLPKLERVEPSSWWIGMKNPELQLLIHGNEVSKRTVSIQYPGVKIKKVHTVENPNYIFVDLEINPSTKPGKAEIKLKLNYNDIVSYPLRLELKSKDVKRIQGVTSKDLIYLIMPDRFANGDRLNDSVLMMREKSTNRKEMYARHGGDIQGIMDRLNYLRDIGITTIWCTPEVENDQPFASYHGYAVTDHYEIDPRYGTRELYKTFADQCHSLGLKVIKDVVHNHIGSEHWWLKDLPMQDWIHQWPEYTQTTYKDQTLMDPYGSHADRKKMTDGWFARSMPDLNESNPFVQHYLTQNHIWWIEYAGIDGLRLDTYQYNDPEYMSKWAQEIKAEYPRIGIFGETLVNSVINQAFFTQGSTIHQNFDTHLPGVTDVQIKDAIYEVINEKNGWTEGVNRLYSVLANDFVYEDPNRNVIFLDNHDMSRFFSMVGEDLRKYKMGIAILLTIRGIPQIYYGTEILMKNFSNPDGLVREDFPGGWQEDSISKFEATGRTEIENEAFNYFRELARYRQRNECLQTGRTMQFVPEKGVYVYFRYNQNKTVMVIVNSGEKKEILSTARFKERLAIYTKAINVITHETIKNIQTIELEPQTVTILELQ